MSDEPVHFQWQNDSLRETIYPLRETKLRDFLVYYHEIDLWAAYKDKQPQDIPQEIEAYQKTQRRKWNEAIEKYYALKDYFERDLMVDDEVIPDYKRNFPNPDRQLLKAIDKLHKRFKNEFSAKNSIRHERWFLVARVGDVEKLRKELLDELANHRRTLRNVPNHTRKDLINARILELDNITTKMADQELRLINEFMAAFNKLETRRVELDKWRKRQADTGIKKLAKIKKNADQIASLQEQIDDLNASIDRLRKPDAFNLLKSYFLDENVADDYEGEMGEVDTVYLTRFNQAHKYISGLIPTTSALSGLLARLYLTYVKVWKPATELSKVMVRRELGKLKDFADLAGKSQGEIEGLVAQKEAQRQALEGERDALQADTGTLEGELKKGEKDLALPLKEQIAQYTGFQEISVRDVVRSKAEDFKNVLAPRDESSMPAVAVRQLALKTIQPGAGSSPPDFVPLRENGQEVKLPAGTRMRVSRVLKISAADNGDGLIHSRTGETCYAIIECPDLSSAVGAFIPAQGVEEIDQRKLLEFVVARFMDKPEDYPLWLQYMVIHFSGMRYQSAHGSWADPRELLTSLIEKAIEVEVQSLEEDAVQAQCEQRLLFYDPDAEQDLAQLAQSGVGVEAPKLAQTEDMRWLDKVEHHLKALKATRRRVFATPREGRATIALYQQAAGGELQASPGDELPKGAEFTVEPGITLDDETYYRIQEYPANPILAGAFVSGKELALVPDPARRKALLDLRVDEKTYEIAEVMDDPQVLAELEKVKDLLKLPNWMWNEIVRLTDLRLKWVKSTDWEEVSPDDLIAREDHQYRAYRELMNKWKKENLTTWREQHDKSNRLVVTRAVCNEVAEHIQHLRGHSPPGGLTAKPEWYQRKEQDPKLAKGSDRPFFVKARELRHFQPGASLFWLRYVDSEPNAWRIAHPLTVQGEGLITPQLALVKGNVNTALRRAYRSLKNRVSNAATDWLYYQDSQGRYKRYRYLVGANNERLVDEQWLRWMHEATVAMVAETADGMTVLTFETALPYEDRRRSTIGVFKHTFSGLKYNLSPRTFIGSFLGYLPQGEVPLGDIKEMLDWDKVLPGNTIPAEKKKAYWERVERQLAAPKPEGGSGPLTAGQPQLRTGSRVEVSPNITGTKHPEYTVAFLVDAASKRARPQQPRVELMRGTLLWVAKDRAETFGGVTYYPITASDAEPRALELYVRSGEIVDAPEGQSSIPVALKEKQNLLELSKANVKGFPVMVEYFSPQDHRKLPLPAGAKCRISTVHRITDRDKGSSGVIHADSGDELYLIVECPGKPAAVGLFLFAKRVDPISEEDYKQGVSLADTQELQELRVVAAPRQERESIFIFARMPNKLIERSGNDVLARGASLVVHPEPAFQKGKEYYRLLQCQDQPQFVGRYVNVKDVAVPVDVNGGQPGTGSGEAIPTGVIITAGGPVN